MKRFLTAVCLAVLCAGCTQYYKVTDPSTGKVYYTDNVETRQGTTVLKDARTGNQVNIQNSEVEKISKEKYESGKNAMPAQPSGTEMAK